MAMPSSPRQPPPATVSPARDISRGAEVVRWPQLALLLPLAPLLVLLAAVSVPRQRQLVVLEGEQPASSRPFRLHDGWLGSPEIRLRAELPPNTAMALAVDLLDPAGQTVLQFDQEGWREQGIWQEDGESGRYDESDAELRLQLRPRQGGDHTLRLALEEFTDAAGRPLPASLRVALVVDNHSVDGGLLLITAAVTAVLVRLLWVAVYGDCRQRRRLRVDDDGAALRLELGGAGLVRVQVLARYEEPDLPPVRPQPAPRQVELELAVSDAWGAVLLRERLEVPLRHYSNDGDHWWVVNTSRYLRLSEPASLRLRASLPDPLAGGAVELEWIQLLVEDGVVTAWPVAVTPLRSPG
ncbi:hypothetical protein [Cyanobium sp. CH-040]|uniref:hypothetical protein n=1 Tax=Cyanobium sp. CH-040 TaxID=2823708 RepID=UPI0020CCD4C0|nr:hypothetical protein [Cyanobium sp. CH-040]MCP9927509.1 hypothetical protein [Cyanobium sp. CH-040]